MLTFFSHASELYAININAYAKCLGVMYPLVQQEVTTPELLMFINKTLALITLS